MKKGKRSRVPALLLLLILPLCLFSCGSEDGDGDLLPSVFRAASFDGFGTASDGCVKDGVLYAAIPEEGLVRAVSLDGGAVSDFSSACARPLLIASDKSGIRVLDGGEILTLGPDGEAVEVISLPDGEAEYVSLDAGDGILALASSAKIWVRSADGKDAGGWSEVSSPEFPVLSVRVRGSSRLLVVTEEEGGTLFERDLKKGTDTALSGRTCRLASVAGGKGGGAVCFTDGRTVSLIGKDGIEPLGMLKAEEGETPLLLEVSSGAVFALFSDRASLTPRRTEENTLVLLCPDDCLEWASVFVSATDLSAKLLPIQASAYADKLNARLLAGDRDFDVVLLSGGSSTVQTVRTLLRSAVRYGQFADLGEDETLGKNLSETMPGVLDLMTAPDGRIFMLPLSFAFEFHRFDVRAAEDIPALSPPDPVWSAEELWDACDALKGTGRSVFGSLYPRRMSIDLLNLVYGALDSAGMDFLNAENLTPDAEEIILAFLRDAEPHLVDGTLFGEDPVFPLSSVGDLSAYGAELYGAAADGSEFALYPVSEDGGSVSLSVDSCLFVNPNTPRKDLALSWLAELTGEEHRYDNALFRAPLWLPLDRYYNGSPGVPAWSKGSEAYFAELNDFLPAYYEHSRLEWADMTKRAIDAGLALIEGRSAPEETARILYEELVYAAQG